MTNLLDFFGTYSENWASWWPQLIPAIWVTIKLTIASFMLAVALGFVLALGKLSHNVFLRGVASGYVELARGIPALAVLFLLYFGLVSAGIVLDAFTAGFVGLGMSGGGGFAEVFRAGILAVHRGQREASAAVGMTPFASFRYIVLPQAIRVVLPPMTNMLISLRQAGAQSEANLVDPVFPRSRRADAGPLFDLAIDSKLRGCDLVKLKNGSLVSGPAIRTRSFASDRRPPPAHHERL